MSDNTPSTELVRNVYSQDQHNEADDDGELEGRDIFDFQDDFDRWLNTERARIWDEGEYAGQDPSENHGNPYRSTPNERPDRTNRRRARVDARRSL